MQIKTLIRLCGLLVLIGLIVLIVKCAGEGQGVTTVESSDAKKKVFVDFPINEVGQLKLVDKENTVTLKKGDTTWVVEERDNYPADGKKVLDLVRTVWDLDIAQPVPLQRNQYGRVQLLDPAADETGSDEAATVLEIGKDDGSEIGSIWLGKVHETSDGRANPFGGGMMMSDAGRYVKRGGSNAVFLVGETFRDAATKASDWLDNSFFQVEKIKSISRKTAKPEEDWSLSREELTGEFVLGDLKDGEELDTTKVSSMKSAFSSPRFEDVLTGEEAKDPTQSVFTVTTFDGFTYVIAAGEKNDLNELPLSVKVSGKFAEKREEGEEETDEEKKRKDTEFENDLKKKQEKLANEKKLEGRVFKVRSFVVDSISKTRAEILKEKTEEAETPAGTVSPPEAPKGGNGAPRAKSDKGQPKSEKGSPKGGQRSAQRRKRCPQG